jgi:hypothetical protein
MRCSFALPADFRHWEARDGGDSTSSLLLGDSLTEELTYRSSSASSEWAARHWNHLLPSSASTSSLPQPSSLPRVDRSWTERLPEPTVLCLIVVLGFVIALVDDLS